MASNSPSGNNVPSSGGNVLASTHNVLSGNNVPSTAAAVVSPPGLAALEFWHDSQNVDLTNNSSLVDGQAIGTWKNAGVRAALGDVLQATAANKPKWDLVASAGKLNNKSSIECVDAARQMASGAFTTIPQPYQVAFVWRGTNAANQIVVTGLPIDPQIAVLTANSHLSINAGGGAVDVPLVVSANVFHTCVITFNGASSVARVDGVASSAFNPGSVGFQSVLVLMSSNSPGGVLGLIGFLVEHLVYSTPQVATDIEAYFAARYGAFPQ